MTFGSSFGAHCRSDDPGVDVIPRETHHLDARSDVAGHPKTRGYG